MVMDTESLTKRLSMVHGKARTYNHGCRCKKCKEAISLYNRDRRSRAQGSTDRRGHAKKVEDLFDIMVELGLAEYSEAWHE